MCFNITTHHLAGSHLLRHACACACVCPRTCRRHERVDAGVIKVAGIPQGGRDPKGLHGQLAFDVPQQRLLPARCRQRGCGITDCRWARACMPACARACVFQRFGTHTRLAWESRAACTRPSMTLRRTLGHASALPPGHSSCFSPMCPRKSCHILFTQNAPQQGSEGKGKYPTGASIGQRGTRLFFVASKYAVTCDMSVSISAYTHGRYLSTIFRAPCSSFGLRKQNLNFQST